MMFRRQFLTLVGPGIVSAGSAIARDGDEIISGFDEALAAGSPILIHITAPWCEVYQLQKPLVTKVLSQPDFKGMKTFEVDFDSQKEILARYRVQMQSTMIVYKTGEEVDRQTGQSDPAVIEALLRKAL
jgi:thiol-disulfide isomerase/thioredoxin